jgi:preprotein translocase subunit YajC
MNAAPLIFLVAIAALLWFLLIRPQRQRQAAHVRLLAEVAPGDDVVTAGGLLGTVRRIADDHIALEVAPGMEIRIAREAITGILRKDEVPASEASEAETPG